MARKVGLLSGIFGREEEEVVAGPDWSVETGDETTLSPAACADAADLRSEPAAISPSSRVVAESSTRPVSRCFFSPCVADSSDELVLRGAAFVGYE